MRCVSLLIAMSLVLFGCKSAEIIKATAQSIGGYGTWENPHYKVGNPYRVDGKWYYPKEDPHYDETGYASWYGDDFHRKPTANGEIFDKYKLTAAHRTLPLPSIVKVTNLTNGRSIRVRVNDRGPFTETRRIIDLSEAAAETLGFKDKGLVRVRVTFDQRSTEILFDKEDIRGEHKRVASQKARLRHPPKSSLKQGSKYIQVASFVEVENAQRLHQRLEEIDRRAFVEKTVYPERTVYRVRVGPISNLDSADKILKQIREEGYEDAIIVN